VLERTFLAISLCLLWACGDETPDSGPGPLVDNTRWEPSDGGQEHFGAAPEGSECLLEPMDCDEEYPWPAGGCVTFDPTSTCIASYVPECFQGFTVLAVYTRMPDNRIPLCNWLTLEQPSLRAIRPGDQVEVRAYHFRLTEPVPGEARMSFVIGDEVAFDETVLIPSDSQLLSATWTATKDYPAGTPLLWHVENHGTNEYLLIEVNVLE